MSRRKQSNPKPAKRETEDFNQIVPNDQFPTNQIYLRKFGGETLVLAREHLSAGTILGAYKCDLREPEDKEDKAFLKVNRYDGGSPVHVMLENEGHWLKLMRNAIVPTDANICLRISGGDILCTVTKDVNKEVELKVTCRIAEPISNQISEKEDKSEKIRSDCLNESKVCSVGMLNHNKEETNTSEEDMTSVKVERSTRESPVDNVLNENKCNGSEYPDEDMRHEMPSSGKFTSADELAYRERKTSLSTDVDRNNLFEDGGIYRCPLCTFQTSKRQAFEKHAQSHRSPSFKRATSQMTNAQSFCESCSIQFMSVDTYYVHKKYYCKSRHDKEESSQSPPVSEASPIARAFKPSADTVILRSGAVNESVTTSLIQPQAIYAAISTNPLILLPCSLVNGEGLVAQNSVIATGGPGIVLQTGIACPTIVEKPSNIKPKEENPPSRKTSHPIMNFTNESSSERTQSNSSSIRKRKMSEGDVLNLKKTLTTEVTAQDMSSARESVKSPLATPLDQDSPLDLSLKRKKLCNSDQKISIMRSSTLKRKNSSITGTECPSPIGSGDSCSSPRSIVVSTTRMVTSPSSSYSNESMPCYSSQMPVLLQKSLQAPTERLSPAPPVLPAETSNDKSVLPPGMPPPKLLKQGNNVCEACNIVFYKLDNYLAHKQHYCAFRRQQLSALAAAANAAALNNNQEQSSDDNNSNHSALNESIQGYTMDESSKSAVQRRTEPGDHIRSVISKTSQSTFICDACGVKYSSMDTLNAHQTYYCSKRADSFMSKFVNNRNENNSSPNSCEPPPFSGPEEWKCNFCDATCSSYETIRRHLLTHSELKRFRCLVCGYKGNTLRGMRNHACTHLKENTTSIDEFVSSTVISENGALPGIIRGTEFSDEDSNPSRDHLPNRERTSSESHRLITAAYDMPILANTSDSNEVSYSPNTNDSSYRDGVPNVINSVKVENRESSPEASGSSQQDGLNPLAFCDVVIKTENDQTSSGDESHDGRPKSSVKSEPEPDPDSDSDGRELVLSESPPLQPTSVIRCVSDRDRCGEKLEQTQPSKRKSRTQTQVTSELKYCKSCDISFYHMSNFVAHKKYYCSRPVPNCLQETTTVQ